MADINRDWIREFVQELIKDAVSEINKCPAHDSPKSSPFSLECCFGDVKNQIQLNKTNVSFAVSHLGVLYDAENETTAFLPGLINAITSSSHNGEHLVLADAGVSDTGIALWDWKKRKVLRYWKNVFPTGTKLIALSPCGNFLTAVSHTPEPTIVRLAIHGPYRKMGFLKPGNPAHLINFENESIITYAKTIIRVVWNEPFEFEEFETPKISTKMGLYQITNILEPVKQIVTGTSCGHILIWSRDGKYLKKIKLRNSAICGLKVIDHKILTTFEDNTEQLFDPMFRILDQKTKPEKPSSIIVSIEIHPDTSVLITGTEDGKLTSYDFENKTKNLSKKIVGCQITCLKFSPTGSKLAIGSSEGDLLLIEPTLLTIETIFPSTSSKVSRFLFPTEEELIFINAVNTIGVLKQSSAFWTPCGQFRPHNFRIIGAIAKGNKLYTVAEDRMLVEMDTTKNVKLVECTRIEETAIPTACAWYKNEIVSANDNFRIRFIDPQTKMILRTVRSPGSSPIHIMIDYQDEIFFAAGNEIGVWGNGSCVIAHATQVVALVLSEFFLFTVGENDRHVLKWRKTLSRIPNPVIRFSPLIENQLSKIFADGAVNKSEVVKFLQVLGYFPTRFDIENIHREIPSKVGEKMFRKILWNHGPPPEIAVEDLRNALLSISDTKAVIETKKIISILQNVQKLGHDESLKCLQTIFAPGHVPPKISLDYFLDLLGLGSM